MKRTQRLSFIILPIILALFFSTLGAMPVYAEEITPPVDQTAEPVAENSPTDTALTNPADILQPTQEATLESLVETAAVPPAADPIATESPVEEILDTLPEILDQVPEGTEIILLNSEGEQESLASQEAAETLITGDPIWCPASLATPTPSLNGCTASYTTFNDLISALTTDADLGTSALYTGDGVIWVADSYSGNDDEDIYINGDTLSNISSNNLTIQGGWNDGTVDDGISMLDVSMMLSNWIGDVTINNIFVNGSLFSDDKRGHGLIVDIDGDITLNNVEVSNIPLSSVADFDTAARVSSAGSVQVSDSVFNNNATGLGLEVDSRSVSGSDSVTLTNVTASENSLMGVYVNTCIETSEGVCTGLANLIVQGTSVFNNNDWDGLYAFAGGTTNITSATASTNGHNGIYIDSGSIGTGGAVTLEGITADNNSAGGANISSSGTAGIQLNNSNFNGNGDYGVNAYAKQGDILLNYVTQSGLNSPALPGLPEPTTTTGAVLFANGMVSNISVFNSVFNYNVEDGLYIDSTHSVTLNADQVKFNSGYGLEIYSLGDALLSYVNASNNTLDGARIDTCAYNPASGLCVGSGIISLNSSLFSDNGGNGIYLDSSLGVTADAVTASYNDANGASIIAVDDNGTGNVVIGGDSIFSNNETGTGLLILSDKDISLMNVLADFNNMGAILDTTPGVGAISVVQAEFDGNSFTGLHAQSGNDISLGSFEANDNGSDGAYLVAKNNISVTGGTVFNNARDAVLGGNGLYAESQAGNITTYFLLAQENEYGAGANLVTHGAGTIEANIASANNQTGIQAQTENGGISLLMSVLSKNTLDGATLNSTGKGNILVLSSGFIGNGQIGLVASTNQGNITLNSVQQTGMKNPADTVPTTQTGAVLSAYAADSLMEVLSSVFNNNIGDGLYVVSNGTVSLVDNTMDANGGNGAQIINSLSSKTCYKMTDKGTRVIVTENLDTFSNNGKWGLLVKPGSDGSLTFVGGEDLARFPDNILGTYLLDTSSIPPCPVEPSKPVDDGTNLQGKSYKFVDVPFSGSESVPQECSLFAGTILQLPDGTSAKLPCPFAGSSSLQGLTLDGLPAQLDDLGQFDLGVLLGLSDENGSLTINADGSITITMKIPETSLGRRHTVLFWDPTLKDGAGAWFQMPPFEKGSGYMLDEADGRMIFSGVQEQNGFVTFTVNFPGIFVLVSK